MNIENHLQTSVIIDNYVRPVREVIIGTIFNSKKQFETENAQFHRSATLVDHLWSGHLLGNCFRNSRLVPEINILCQPPLH